MQAKIRFLPGKARRKPEKRKCLDGKVEENRSHAKVACVLFFLLSGHFFSCPMLKPFLSLYEFENVC